MRSQIGQWGNSLAVRIPKHIAQALNLQPNDAIEFSVVDGKAVIEPVCSPHEFTLDELLSQITEPSQQEVDWGKPEGEKIW